MTVSVNGTTGITFNDASTQNTAATGFGFKNRIINGAMQIDQRNAGAAVTSGFPVDRFNSQITNGAVSMQQSSVAPAGFTKSLSVTVTSASTPSANDRNAILHNIEGFNIADFGLGTATPSTFTLSFWVRSSLTGTFSGMVGADTNPSYVYTYVINSANTWEYKTITIAGTSTGTWGSTNGFGLTVRFDLGTGSDRRTTPNVWNSADYRAATGAVQLIANSGATFYITGVQLEKGSTATSFDYRPYGTELALCQRYFEKSYNTDVALGTATQVSMYATSNSGGSTGYGSSIVFKVTKRATPTMVGWTYTGTLGSWHYGVYGSSEGTQTLSFGNIGSTVTQPFMGSIPTSQNAMYGHWAASAEL
jgi:hypothetical protein